MIQIFISFVLTTLLVAFAYHAVSKFTLREYKLAFKVVAAAIASALILVTITLLF
jgi:hypothetical protein